MAAAQDLDDLGALLTPEGYMPRVVDREMQRGLEAAGWVVIEGPRACGKTWTGLRFARSAVRLDTDARTMSAAQPEVLLRGPTPRLIDEWQVLPSVWNHIRHACDSTRQRGLFVLAGSAQPADDATRHTGVGRARRIQMRPMCLFESGDSSAEISLSGLLDGAECSAGRTDGGLDAVAEVLCRGGWPGQLDLPLPEVQQNLRDYLGEVARTDIGRLDGRPVHNPVRVERLLRSLSRNTASEASHSTLAADVGPESLHRHSVREYLESLRRLFVLEEQPAWPVRLRSRAALRKSPKLHLVDPSLAAAALGANPAALLRDASTLGLLFESLVVRDLRVLSQPHNGRVWHIRDAAGHEADAVVECPDGRRLITEVKLGGAEAIETAAISLKRLADRLDTTHWHNPAQLAVITATGYGYTRKDGVHVVPITALGP